MPHHLKNPFPLLYNYVPFLNFIFLTYFFYSQVSSLIAELESAAAAERGITFDDGMVARLCAYSRAVAHFPTAVKEVSTAVKV